MSNSKIWLCLPHLSFTLSCCCMCHHFIFFYFRLSGSPRRARTSRSAGNPRNSGETEDNSPSISHTCDINFCAKEHRLHAQQKHWAYVSHVCWVFLQGMPGPQGPLGPPGEKVRNQTYIKSFCIKNHKIQEVNLFRKIYSTSNSYTIEWPGWTFFDFTHSPSSFMKERCKWGKAGCPENLLQQI